jgi:branched-subunit amino acid transport protein
VTASTPLFAAVIALAVGTATLRFAGSSLRTRIDLPPRLESVLAVSTVVLFAALIATAALLDGREFAGVARPVGVAVGGWLAWRGASLIVVVIAAAASTAGLRLLGLP